MAPQLDRRFSACPPPVMWTPKLPAALRARMRLTLAPSTHVRTPLERPACRAAFPGTASLEQAALPAMDCTELLGSALTGNAVPAALPSRMATAVITAGRRGADQLISPFQQHLCIALSPPSSHHALLWRGAPARLARSSSCRQPWHCQASDAASARPTGRQEEPSLFRRSSPRRRSPRSPRAAVCSPPLPTADPGAARDPRADPDAGLHLAGDASEVPGLCSAGQVV